MAIGQPAASQGWPVLGEFCLIFKAFFTLGGIKDSDEREFLNIRDSLLDTLTL